MNYEQELEELKIKIDNAKALKMKAEARMEQLKIQESQILDELTKIGILPENLENEISTLQREIESGINKIKELMPDMSELK